MFETTASDWSLCESCLQWINFTRAHTACIWYLCNSALHFITTFVMRTVRERNRTSLNGSSVCNREEKGDLAISSFTVSNLPSLVDPLSSGLSS